MEGDIERGYMENKLVKTLRNSQVTLA